jgi:ribose transport system substrate-binding protein
MKNRLCLVICSLILSTTLGFAAQPKIGVLLKDRTPGFWVYAEKGAADAAQALGAEIVVRAPIAVTDVGAQSKLLASLATEKLDALVIAPSNPESIESAVSALAKSGVKIVTLDTPLKTGLAQCFVGADHQAMSDAATKVLLAALTDGDQVALLRNNSIDRPVLIRERTVMDALKSRKVTLHADIFASTEKDSEEQRALLLLERHPNVKIVFASATRGTLAVIKAVRAKNLVGKVKVIGFGLYLPEEVSAAFKDGILLGWIAQQPKDVGYKGVSAALDLIAGKTIPEEIHPAFTVITPQNYMEPAIAALAKP